MAHNPKHKLLSSPKNNLLSSSLLEHTQALSSIESNLNHLCSQHDSLMPLLSLLETLPSLSKTSSTIKTYLRKMQQVQKAFQSEKQTHHYNEMGSMHPQSLPQINNILSSISQCNESLREFQQIISTNNESSIAALGPTLPEPIEQTLQQHKKQMQYFLSESKNNVEMKYRNNHFNIILSKEYSKLIPESLFEEYKQEISNLYREIEMVNMSLEGNLNYDIMEFHSFTCQRIEYELYQTNEIIALVIEQRNYRNYDVIDRRVEMLYYQIKGLRKKCLLEFNRKAKEGKSVKTQVDTVKKDLHILQQKWNETKKFLTKLLQSSKFDQKSPLPAKLKTQQPSP